MCLLATSPCREHTHTHTTSLFLCLCALCYFPKPIIIFISAWRLRPVGLVPEAAEPAVVQWFVMTSWQRAWRGGMKGKEQGLSQAAAGLGSVWLLGALLSPPQLASRSLVSLWRWGASVRPELHLTGEDQSPTLMRADTVKYPLTLCAALWVSNCQMIFSVAARIAICYLHSWEIHFFMKWYANVMLLPLSTLQNIYDSFLLLYGY